MNEAPQTLQSDTIKIDPLIREKNGNPSCHERITERNHNLNWSEFVYHKLKEELLKAVFLLFTLFLFEVKVYGLSSKTISSKVL